VLGYTYILGLAAPTAAFSYVYMGKVVVGFVKGDKFIYKRSLG